MTDNGKIPFLDLVSPHRELEEELVSVFRTALRTAAFVGGSMVEDFEREFSEYCGTQNSVGVASGTDALRFALIAAGIRPGDTVVTVPNTFIATTEAISQAGARPEFVDIDERTYNMDPQKLRAYLETRCYRERASGKLFSHRTGQPVTAIVPVHLYGQMADMDPILELAERHGLIVIEDACQAHGAEYFSGKENRWRKAGSIGQAAAFSFYPSKNLGACGEAGAVTTNSEVIAQKIRMLRDHGQARKYYHDIEGYNGRLDALHGGILRVKLRHLPGWNQKRQHAAQRYDEMLSSVDGVISPYKPDWVRAINHLYVIRVQDRDRLQRHLTQGKIDTGIHYPIPLHLQKAYENLSYKAGDFPVAEAVASSVLSLPMHSQLEAEEQRRVIQAIVEFTSVGNRCVSS